MSPARLLVLLVSLPLLLGGCWENHVAETKPELEGVNQDELELREGIWYLKGQDTPYTGKIFAKYSNGKMWREWNYKNGKVDGLQVEWHQNGKKWNEVNYKDGKRDGLWVQWHKNGQKRDEENWKDGEVISAKYWNSKGEPVDSSG
jgi:antitoxin component YwqK of YwqJK toxin-antitoxin module